MAIWSGRPLDLALADFIDPLQVVNERRFTDLHRAALNMSKTSLETLLEESTEGIDSKDRDGHTPLFWVVYRGDTSGVKTLLSYGANPDSDGSALVWSCNTKCEDPSCLRMLLDAGADKDVFDADGFTALHATTINHRSQDFIRLLLESGADLEKAYSGEDADLIGLTALDFTCFYGPTDDLLRVLLSFGADFQHVDRKGRSPLHFALAKSPWGTVKDRPRLVKMLLDYGIEVNLVDRLGQTPAHDAMVNQDLDSLKILSAHGATLVWPLSRGPAKNGYYQLAWIIETNNHIVLEYLLNETSINICDVCTVSNQTVLHLLAKYADRHSIVLFEQNLTDVWLDTRQVDTFGKTAKDYLRERTVNGARAIASFLQRIEHRHTARGIARIFEHSGDLRITPLPARPGYVRSEATSDTAVGKEIEWIDSTYGTDEYRETSDEEHEAAEAFRPTIARPIRRSKTSRATNVIQIETPVSNRRSDTNRQKSEEELIAGALHSSGRGSEGRPKENVEPGFWRLVVFSIMVAMLVLSLVAITLILVLPTFVRKRRSPFERLFALLLRPRVAKNCIRITWNCVSRSHARLTSEVGL